VWAVRVVAAIAVAAIAEEAHNESKSDPTPHRSDQTLRAPLRMDLTLTDLGQLPNRRVAQVRARGTILQT
jgi:hypothetical protein